MYVVLLVDGAVSMMRDAMTFDNVLLIIHNIKGHSLRPRRCDVCDHVIIEVHVVRLSIQCDS